MTRLSFFGAEQQRASAIGSIKMSGTVSFAASALLGRPSGSLPRLLTNVASMPAWMKQRAVRVGSVASCPPRTRDKSKRTSARLASACLHCSFFTHGWVNQRAYRRPADRRNRPLLHPPQTRRRTSAHLHRVRGVLCGGSLVEIRL